MDLVRPILIAALLGLQAPPDDAALRDLVRKLGDPDAVTRDRAEEELRRAGTRAESILVEAKKTSDPEILLRVQRLLRDFERRAKRDRLRAVADPPLLVLAPGDVANQIHRVDLKTGQSQRLVDYSSTISGLQWDDLSGRISYYMQQEGPRVLQPGAAKSDTLTPLELRSHRGIAWSPAGDSLLLVSDIDGATALHLLTLASKEVVRLTPEKQSAFEPSWSPDAKHIAYVRNDGMSAKGCDLYRISVAAPRVPQRLTTDDAAKVGTAWSPDGRWIAFAWVDEPSLGILSVSDPKLPPLRIGGQGDHPAWSPDSASLAYVRILGAENQGDLRVVDREGKKDRVLVGGRGLKAHPVWSPDGKRIAFDWSKDNHPQVFVVNADGTDLRQVTSLPQGASSPVWAPQE
jgi:Tol biopolymer transport system component